MKKIISSAWLLGVLCAVGATFEAPDTFSITLPENWVDVSRNVLDAHSERLASLAPHSPRQVYGYGYQLKSYDDRLCYPYILVQVKTIGRIPLRELKQSRKIEEGFAEGADPVTARLPGFLSNVSSGEPVYDEENQILWSTLSASVEGVGTVRALSAAKLTDQGFIQFVGYATADMFEPYAALYRRIFTQVEVDPSIVYRSRWTEDIPLFGGIDLATMVAAGINGAVVGGIIWFAMALRRKKKNR